MQEILKTLTQYIREQDIERKIEGTLPRSATFEELNYDSLDLIDLVWRVESEFEVHIPNHDVKRFRTLGDLAGWIERHTTCQPQEQ